MVRALKRCLRLAVILLLSQRTFAFIDYRLHGKLCYPQRYNRKGRLVETAEIPSMHGPCLPIEELMQQCFHGMGNEHCSVMGDRPQLPSAADGDSSYAGGSTPFVKKFCLECCSNDKDSYGFEETWNLKCPTKKEPEIDTDVFGHVFQFARLNDYQDVKMVSCPLHRSPVVHRVMTTSTVPVHRRTATVVHIDDSDTTKTPTGVDNTYFTVEYEDGVIEDSLHKLDITSQKELIKMHQAANEFKAKSEDETTSLGIKVGDTVYVRMIRGYFQAELAANVSQPMFYRSVGNLYEEFLARDAIDDPGKGKGESIASKLEMILNLYDHPGKKDLAPLSVSRHGPYAHNGYTWSITFPDGTYTVPLMKVSAEVSMNFSQPELYAKIQPLESLKYASLQIERVPQPILQGYHLTLEVEELADDQGNVWRQVQYCTANATEGTSKPDHIFESYTVQRSSGLSHKPAASSALLLVLACLLACYMHL